MKKANRLAVEAVVVSEWNQARAGDRVVVKLYLIIVAVAGIMGFILGVVRPADLEPVLFGVIPLPPTPFGVAIYGVVTIGTILGILLGLVIYISERYDDAGV